MITQQEYAARRQRIAKLMLPHSIAFISAAAHPFRTYETEYAFRQDSDFYYLTGFSETKAIAVLTSEGEFTLFNQPFDLLAATWTGPLAGQEGAVRDFGAKHSYPYSTFSEKFAELLAEREVIYYPFNDDPYLPALVTKTLDQLQYKIRYGLKRPDKIINLQELIHPLRRVKSAAEIDILSRVCEISAQAHKHCMQRIRPAMHEYQMEAEFIYYVMQRGCRFNAYGNIVAAGANACTLHYQSNMDALKEGELLLMDAGAEMENYASDITRTYPANGRYSAEQKAVYEIVLRAQLSCLDKVKPGATHAQLEENAIRILTEGLIDLKILKGDVNARIEDRSYRKFYMHRIGHWMGLDVHDRGSYHVNGQSIKLESGMVMTVEPGLYISPNTEGVDPRFYGIGIRIEDNVLVTEKGNRVLTASAPKTIADIEALMAK